jgi:hypothetical protein
MPALPPAVANTLLRYNAAGELETVAVSTLYDEIGSPTAPTSPSVGDFWDDLGAIKVATPTISPAAGSYAPGQEIAVACTTSGVTIHYTTDGSTPTTGSPVYSAPLTLSAAVTVKALAVKSGWFSSEVASAAYTVQPYALLNPGFEDALGSEWTHAGTGTSSRVGVDSGVTPPVGSYQLKLATTALVASSRMQQITGALYRLLPGTLQVRFACASAVLTTDANVKLFLAVLAYDVANALIGRTDFILAGNYAGLAPSGQDDLTYRTALSAGVYAAASIDVRGSVDPKVVVAAGSVDAISYVRFYFRLDTNTATSRNAYFDDLLMPTA